MTIMIIAVTGHRPNKLWGYNYEVPQYISLKNKMQEILEEQKPEYIISGMAIGVDTVFAIAGLQLEIPLECAIPCLNQEQMWSEEAKKLYHKILDRAWKITYVSKEPYAAWLMQKRNEYMVDNCDLLIAVWDGTAGGTANCVKYAKATNKQIIFINPKNCGATHEEKM